MADIPAHSGLQEPGPLYVASLAKGMILLESFKEGSPFLGITELARITGFEKNLVQRLSNTLHKMGYLEKDEIRRK